MITENRTVRKMLVAALTAGSMLMASGPVWAYGPGRPDPVRTNLLSQSAAWLPAPVVDTQAMSRRDVGHGAASLDVAAVAAEGYVILVNRAKHLDPAAGVWPQAKVQAIVDSYDEAIQGHYAGDAAFGSLDRWAAALRISRANPIVVLYVQGDSRGAPARAAWRDGVPIITHYRVRTAVPSQTTKLVLHEIAHIWDHAHGWSLSQRMVATVQNPEGYPTAKARDEGPREDFAESVTAVLWDGYAVNDSWTDDRGLQPDAIWALDRYDYVEALFDRATTDQSSLR